MGAGGLAALFGGKRCNRSFAGIPSTSGIAFAFILDVFPLAITEGAGAEMQQTLGTAVFAFMIDVTLFGLFLAPLFYFVVRWLVE